MGMESTKIISITNSTLDSGEPSQISGSDADTDPELAPLNTTEVDADASTEVVDPEKEMSYEWVQFHIKKNMKVLSACGFYSFCSVSMVLVNKSLASRYDIHAYQPHNALQYCCCLFFFSSFQIVVKTNYKYMCVFVWYH